MANIVNGTATGGGGLITTGDSSDELQLQTAETARVTLTNTAVVVNEDGNDVDFRVEGDTDANTLFVDAGNDRVGVKTATPAVALDVVGQVRASTGILFGSDTAAANALDDYEEGTWTPAIVGSSTLGTATYVQRPGTYTKVGRLVMARTFIIWNSGTGTGSLEVSGLPFTNSNDGIYGAVTVANQSGVTLTANNYISSYVQTNATRIIFVQSPTGGGTATGVAYDSAGELMVTAVYETA